MFIVVDLHIQRIVLATTEETTVTQQVSHRPTRYQIMPIPLVVTKRCGGQRVSSSWSKSRQELMRYYKQWHRPKSKRFIKPPYLLHKIESSLDRPELLSTKRVLSNKADKSRSNQFWSTSPSFSRPHVVQKWEKMKYRGPWWWRPWAGETGARASIQSSKALCILEKAPRFLPVRRSLLALVGRKQTVAWDQFFPQKSPGSRLWFSRTGVQHSPGSLTIELPSAFAEPSVLLFFFFEDVSFSEYFVPSSSLSFFF